MKIFLASIGSTGDIQPFLILGDFLSKKGHEVRVSSAEMYSKLASNYQVDYVPFTGDYAALIDDEKMKELIGKNPFTMGKQLKTHVYPILENSLDTFLEGAKWADVIIYHPKTLIDTFGYLFPEKLMKAYVVPAFTPTSVFASPLLYFLPIPKFLNKLTYKITNALINTVKTPVNNFKQKHNLKKTPGLMKTPMIYGISESFLSRPNDYPNDHYFTGFWFDTNNSFGNLSEAVATFCESNKKTVVITFGSMPYQSKYSINEFIKAIRTKIDVRILIVKGWGLKDAEIETSENVMVVDKAPYGELFEKVDAVVHHGGAGTTALVLKSGKPQMICPVLHPVGDQYFWGKQTVKKSVGVEPIPLKKLKPQQLANSVKTLLTKDFGDNLSNIRNQIINENALENVNYIIEKHFG